MNAYPSLISVASSVSDEDTSRMKGRMAHAAKIDSIQITNASNCLSDALLTLESSISYPPFLLEQSILLVMSADDHVDDEDQNEAYNRLIGAGCRRDGDIVHRHEHAVHVGVNGVGHVIQCA